jgi:hypothetical protein
LPKPLAKDFSKLILQVPLLVQGKRKANGMRNAGLIVCGVSEAEPPMWSDLGTDAYLELDVNIPA